MFPVQNKLIALLALVIPVSTLGQTVPFKEIIPYEVKRVARLTGKTQKDEYLPNPNQTDEKYNVGGTDLGIAWDTGKGLYGPYLLPINAQNNTLYFTMSMWWPYNVFLMKVSLKVQY